MIQIEYSINGERFSHELPEGNYILGRSKSCDIVIREGSISGQHARIDVTGDSASFRDLLSRNGTVLNGSKVTQGRLSSGCTLRLGHVDLLITMEGEGISDAPTQPAAMAPSVSFADLSDEELAPPPMAGGDYAVATIVPNSSAVEVFQLPASSTPAVDPAALAAKKRIRLLLAALIAAAIAVGGSVYLDASKKPIAKPTEDPDTRYWKAINHGVDEFRQDNFGAAVKLWKSADERYYKEQNERRAAGRTFAQVAQIYQDVRESGRIDTAADWNEMRRKILSMINDNLFSSDLRGFAAELENRCGREYEAQKVLTAAAALKSEKKWDEAISTYKEIPPSSIYYALMTNLNEQTRKEQLAFLRASARSTASGKNYPEAIKIAEEFFGLGGKDEKLSQESAGWRDEVSIAKDMTALRKAVTAAITPQEIQNARQMATSLETRFRDNSRVQGEIPGILRGLNERLFVVQLKELYKSGREADLEELLRANREYQKNAEAQEILSRFKITSAAKAKAEAAEKSGDMDAALTLWKDILAADTTADKEGNHYITYATAKLAQYPPEVIGKKLIEEATRAHNSREFKRARELLTRAKSCEVDISEPLASLHRTGRILFNQGVQSYLRKEYMRTRKEVNDALNCFSREDDFYATIFTWMQKNNIDQQE